jgi:hypothetical protein
VWSITNSTKAFILNVLSNNLKDFSNPKLEKVISEVDFMLEQCLTPI